MPNFWSYSVFMLYKFKAVKHYSIVICQTLKTLNNFSVKTLYCNAKWALNHLTTILTEGEVFTTYPQLAIASAVCCGSKGSGGAGFLLVLTAQNLHPRVQVSPRTIIVAVAIPSPPPFQHSPMLGH